MPHKDSDDLAMKYREFLQEAHQNASRDYDKTVVTLATGALALSVTFVRQLREPVACSEWALATAWVLLTVSVVAVLFSFKTSEATIRRMIVDLDAGSRSDSNVGRWTDLLNVVSGAGLVLGLIFMAVFAMLNVRAV